MISNTVIALAPTKSASEPPMSPEAKTQKKQPHFNEAKLQYKFFSSLRSKGKQSPTFRAFYYVKIFLFHCNNFNAFELRIKNYFPIGKFTHSKDASCHKPLAG